MDVEAQNTEESSRLKRYNVEFSEFSVRKDFIKRVFILVSLMLFIVALMCGIPMIFENVKDYLQTDSGAWLCIGAMILFTIIYIVLAFCEPLRKSYPYNMISLLIFTLVTGFMMSCITSTYTATSVIICFGLTTFISVSIVLYAIFSPKDLLSSPGVIYLIFSCTLGCAVSGVIAIFACSIDFWLVMYGIFASIIFTLYLAIDIQLLMGNRSVAISPEEHVFAAMQIFLDIINIFLLVLSIFGSSN